MVAGYIVEESRLYSQADGVQAALPALDSEQVT